MSELGDQKERLEASLWQVLRNAYLRVSLRGTGKSPIDLTEDEKRELLDPWTQAMLADLDVLREIGDQYRQIGLRQVHEALHGQPGVDHDMLDEAVEYHGQPSGEEEEPHVFFETRKE